MKTKLTHFATRLLPAFLILTVISSFGQLVTNTTTLETFSTIQAAIDDSDTQDGDELLVSAGEYFENIIINKSLTLTGPKAGIDGNDPQGHKRKSLNRIIVFKWNHPPGSRFSEKYHFSLILPIE